MQLHKISGTALKFTAMYDVFYKSIYPNYNLNEMKMQNPRIKR